VTDEERAMIYGRQSRGRQKSITDQIDDCTRDAEEQGWTVTGADQDGISASRFASHTRDAWPRVLAAIDAAAIDVLVLWESSRGDRDAEQWLGLLRRCRDRGVRIRITSHERTYNPAVPADWKALANDGIDSQTESERLSQRVRRGVAAAARKGRPPQGPVPYGYRRTYDPHTGELSGQEPDPVTAPIAREIIMRAARSESLSAIVQSLNDRGIPAPYGGIWRRQRVRAIALNVAYIGLRKHTPGERETIIYPAGWQPLVDEATFYAATRILSDPARAIAYGRPVGATRPGKQVHLLAYLATCYCGSYVHARQTYYSCCPQGCVSIRRTPVDEFVEDVLFDYLSKPRFYQSLQRAGDVVDREVIEARAAAVKLRSELDEWRRSAIAGKTTPETLAVVEPGLTARIRQAEDRATRLGLHPALRQLLEPGEDVRARWKAMPVQGQRTVLRSLLAVTIHPSGRNSHMPVEDRVVIDWVGQKPDRSSTQE
jgi:site-specific DNA recombinase